MMNLSSVTNPLDFKEVWTGLVFLVWKKNQLGR